MVSHLVQAFEFDIRFRISDDKARPEGAVINTHEIKPGVAFEQNGVKITAIEVDHAPVEPAYGYRIDYEGRSVVLSGDTRISDNLVRAAAGVDLLVDEVVSPETFVRAGVNPERAKSVVAHHVTPNRLVKCSNEQNRGWLFTPISFCLPPPPMISCQQPAKLTAAH